MAGELRLGVWPDLLFSRRRVLHVNDMVPSAAEADAAQRKAGYKGIGLDQRSKRDFGLTNSFWIVLRVDSLCPPQDRITRALRLAVDVHNVV